MAEYFWQIMLEITISFIFLVIVIDLKKRSNKLNTDISKKLLIFMFLYFIATALSTFSQLEEAWLLGTLIPTDINPYFDQTHKLFIYWANFAYYQFFLEIFTTYGNEKKNKAKLQIITTIFIFYSISFPLFGEKYFSTLKLIDTVFLLLHSLFIYIPAFIKSRALYKEMGVDNKGRPAVFSIVTMSFFFVWVWILLVTDSVAKILGIFGSYSPFWFISWILIFIAIVSGYIAYTNPPWFRKWTNRKKGDN